MRAFRPDVGEGLPSTVSEWRTQFFRRQLYIMTYQYFRKAREEIKVQSADLYNDLGIEDDDDS